MAVIAMCAYSTPTNKKDDCLERTLKSLSKSVDFAKHHLGICVNGHTERTKEILKSYADIIHTVIWNEANEGTAMGINRIWREFPADLNKVKMDDDIICNQAGWLDDLERAIARDPDIGQCALKRKDCSEHPDSKEMHYRSQVYMLPHKPGEQFIIAERVNHCMGSAVMHSAALLAKVGYLQQFSKYGLDDSMMSYKSRLAGFKNVFLSYIPIDHIDEGTTDYQPWKVMEAGKAWDQYRLHCDKLKSGQIPLYYNPFQ